MLRGIPAFFLLRELVLHWISDIDFTSTICASRFNR
jgi:hypothetical protein